MTNLIKDGQTMTSLQIAEVTGKQHKDVLRAIRNMEPAWVNSLGRKFALQYKINKLATGGVVKQPYYELTKTECLYIATKFNDEARARLVIRWEELEKEKLHAAAQGSLKEARPLPPPERKTLSVSNLTEIIDGKPVTTSRKLAKLLGRKHDSILDTINANRHQRWFKYGNFIRRPYTEGYAHGTEYLITRKGLSALAGIMRYGAGEKIKEAYEGAWCESQNQIPGLIESTASSTEVQVPSRITERMWSESEIIDLIRTESRKMKERLHNSIQKHLDEGDMFYGPGGEVRLGIPLFFELGFEDGIKRMFSHLTNAYLDAYHFNGSNQRHQQKLQEAGKLMMDILNRVKNS